MRTRISLAGVGLAAAAALGALAAPASAAATEPPPAPATGQDSQDTNLICPTVQNLLAVIQAIPFVGEGAVPPNAAAPCPAADRPDTPKQQKDRFEGLAGKGADADAAVRTAASDD